MTATVERTPDPTTRIERLNRASARLIDPDADLPGAVGEGQLLPDELLSIHQLPEFQDLTPEQKATLSREEIASIVDAGLRFEAVLMAGFSLELVMHGDLTDPAVVYALHEMGEETRHSRLFSRLLSQIQPQARNPLNDRLRKVQRLLVQRLIARPATFDVLVLGGEEIPDLFQKVASEHPDTDPFIREVNRYHRAEEARHLAFARTVLPDRWANASRVDRFLLRHVAPYLIADMFRMLVHPGVYRTIGLPGWSTWHRANRTPARVALRHEATRPILDTLVANGVFKPGRIPKAWRALTGA
jgi:hypothetical protein